MGMVCLAFCEAGRDGDSMQNMAHELLHFGLAGRLAFIFQVSSGVTPSSSSRLLSSGMHPMFYCYLVTCISVEA